MQPDLSGLRSEGQLSERPAVAYRCRLADLTSGTGFVDWSQATHQRTNPNIQRHFSLIFSPEQLSPLVEFRPAA
jgi:hypothetical protein